ncbi:unnamed protein product [Ectocarpus sp. 12 AP-2014]
MWGVEYEREGPGFYLPAISPLASSIHAYRKAHTGAQTKGNENAPTTRHTFWKLLGAGTTGASCSQGLRVHSFERALPVETMDIGDNFGREGGNIPQLQIGKAGCGTFKGCNGTLRRPASALKRLVSNNK